MSADPRQWDEEDWEVFYSDPMHFARLFDDYKALQEQRERFDLSTSQEHQLAVIERTIEAKLGL